MNSIAWRRPRDGEVDRDSAVCRAGEYKPISESVSCSRPRKRASARLRPQGTVDAVSAPWCGRAAKCFIALLVRELGADRWLYTVIGLCCLAATGVLAVGGLLRPWAVLGHVLPWLLLYLVVLPVITMSMTAFICCLRYGAARRAGPAAAFNLGQAARFAAGMLLMAGMGVFLGFYTSIKQALPKLAGGGFGHDALLANLDGALHLGLNPSNFLAQCCSSARLLGLVDSVYSNMWMIATFGFPFATATLVSCSRMRIRFMGLFIVTWAGAGNVLAYVGLSAGPVYFDRVTGNASRYAPLSDMLADNAGLLAVQYQADLWASYLGGSWMVGSGISAFPSVHVASATLLAWFLGEISQAAGIAGWLFCAVILFGSVLLGWHYAIDGYFSILFVTALYFATRNLRSPMSVRRSRTSAAIKA